MKQKIEKLVDKLACKELSFGCKIIFSDMRKGIVYSGTVKIGEVDDDGSWWADTVEGNNVVSYVDDGVILGHPITLQTVLMRPEIGERLGRVIEIYRLWRKCGDKSLQEIIEFELKNTDAQNLINYLLTIFR